MKLLVNKRKDSIYLRRLLMYSKRKAFTLMELLVVIAVIALLLAVLMPSLRKAKEMAGRIICGNHEKQLEMANNLYANNWDEQLCPPMMIDESMPDAELPITDENAYRKVNWLTNMEYRKYMGLDDTGNPANLSVMPDDYFCPADKVARYDKNSQWGVLCSFGYNVTDWMYDLSTNYWDVTPRPGGTRKWLIGHKRTAIPRASEKINFGDSCDWWIVWDRGVNYVEGWDKAHHANWDVYSGLAPGVYGPVLYRHNEGAIFAFYDGHVEYLPKDKAFVDEDGSATDHTNTKDATGMWYVTWP
jgi:prepilin-type N-terminal cleavage/methylation domain-containing protein/prepilin-type processing-associated H-X9-DG protein